MRKKLLKLHEKLSINEQQICEMKIRIMDLEAEKDKKENKLLSKNKEEWKELGITNETGRKAYIKKQLTKNYEQIHNKNITLLYLQTDQKILLRNYELYLEFYKTENITHYK